MERVTWITAFVGPAWPPRSYGASVNPVTAVRETHERMTPPP
jgi:hypothetical protein